MTKKTSLKGYELTQQENKRNSLQKICAGMQVPECETKEETKREIKSAL
jgi:hypothetical protein